VSHVYLLFLKNNNLNLYRYFIAQRNQKYKPGKKLLLVTTKASEKAHLLRFDLRLNKL